MPFTCKFTRKTYKRGDLIDAPDYNEGFVQSATIEDGGTYGFGGGSAALPSMACATDKNTGLYFPEPDVVAAVAGGSTVLSVRAGGVVIAADKTLQLGQASEALKGADNCSVQIKDKTGTVIYLNGYKAPAT